MTSYATVLSVRRLGVLSGKGVPSAWQEWEVTDMLKFFLGLQIGAFIGFITCALLSANGRDDDDA